MKIESVEGSRLRAWVAVVVHLAVVESNIEASVDELDEWPMQKKPRTATVELDAAGDWEHVVDSE